MKIGAGRPVDVASSWCEPGAQKDARASGTHDCCFDLAAHYARLKGRRGHKTAIIAVGHSILIVAYHMLIGHQPYHDVGADYYLRRDEQAHARRLVRQLENLGYDVTLNREDPAA
jgi:hypothetical protein